MLNNDPPPGIVAYLESEDDLSRWKAEIAGPDDSPFQDGIFSVAIQFPHRYPMEPPSCRFTCIPAPYHPNIDTQGRICLDTLKSPPSGSWSPAVSLPSLLLALRSLLATPNPEDGLEAQISQLYKHQPEKWRQQAINRTKEMMQRQHESTKRPSTELETTMDDSNKNKKARKQV